MKTLLHPPSAQDWSRQEEASYWRAQIGHTILCPITVAACNLLWGSGEEKLGYLLTMH